MELVKLMATRATMAAERMKTITVNPPISSWIRATGRPNVNCVFSTR
jgi:hypothetical protein